MPEVKIVDNENLIQKLEIVENKILERGDCSDCIPANYYDFTINVAELKSELRLAIDIFSDEDVFDASKIDWGTLAAIVIDRLEDSEFFGLAFRVLGRTVETDVVLCLSADDVVKELSVG